MWVITVFINKDDIKMYEFETEKEAREAYRHIQGYKLLTEMVTLEPSPALVTI
ncbi:hypothetical protein [Bacillus sp. OTU530]|jgi:hypothetical protein|uniref:hypothetical protein n=1 Tax=Bacillus sp. OTU530 TaxID=3043862 RepID=UPI00313EB469